MIGGTFASLLENCGYPSGGMVSIIGVCLILVGLIGFFAGMAKNDPKDNEIKQVNFKWGGVSVAFGVISVFIGFALLITRGFFLNKFKS